MNNVKPVWLSGRGKNYENRVSYENITYEVRTRVRLFFIFFYHNHSAIHPRTLIVPTW